MLFRKIRTIMIPQITLGITLIMSSVVFDAVLSNTLPFSDIDYLGPFGSWFLPTLFLMELIVIPIISLIHNRIALLFAVCLISILFCLTSYTGIMYIQQVFAASVFGLLGFMSRPLLDQYNAINKKYKGFGWLIILVVAVLSTLNEPIGMYINQYGNKVLFFVTAILGICSVMDISVSLKNSWCIQWFGRNSIIIYVLHFFLVRGCRIIVTHLGVNNYNFIIAFLICLLTIIPMTIICQKKLYFFFGKSNS